MYRIIHTCNVVAIPLVPVSHFIVHHIRGHSDKFAMPATRVNSYRFSFLPSALRAEADFEVFRPAGATRCTGAGEIWHGGRDLLRVKFHPHRCKDKVVGPQKLKFLLRIDQNV